MTDESTPQTTDGNNRSGVIISDNGIAVEEEEIRSEDTLITQPFDPTKIRVDTKPTTLDVLIKRLEDNAIDLSPGFQRKGGIWNEVAQSRLIESMIIRIPLPAFYIDASNDEDWLVVDGLQRLTAIRRFVIDKDLFLEGLEFLTDYNGKGYDSLPRNFQRRIEETDIVLYLIQPGTPPRVKFDIFKRINTGGLPLSSQEIRHALNQGPVTSLLERLANKKAFLTATSRGISPKRMDDRECILRFFAFCLTPPSNYKENDLDGFLNEAMVKLNKMDEKELEVYENRFLRTMRIAQKIFYDDAFRKRYFKHGARHPINKALFETWSVNLDSLNDDEMKEVIENKEFLKGEFIDLMLEDSEFEKAITQGTGSAKRVNKRFQAIQDIIQEVVS